VAAVNRCTATITHPYDDYPPTVNDEESWVLMRRAAEALVGADNIRPMDPLLGGEDFAFFQQRIPGCFSFLGVSAADWETRHNVHHPKFKADESALPLGAAWHTQIILDSLAR
jgi:IAA-amino acid hydrolase